MAMTYTSLVAPKGTAGSLANWINYTKLDTATVLDEAQSLLYSLLRLREMKTEWTFGMAIGNSEIALPDRFLDPAGRLYATNGLRISHKIEADLLAARTFEDADGDFGADPFTTIAGSSSVTVALTAHGLNQGSTMTIAGATATGGLMLDGTWPVTSVETNTLVIDAGTEATSSASGGGSAATYTASNLTASWPLIWSIIDGKIKFNTAFEEAAALKMLYFRSLPLLSSSNLTNFLTDRYPMLLRKACQTAAADFMKDDTEYTKSLGALQAMIQSIAVEGDFAYRAADIDTETP